MNMYIEAIQKAKEKDIERSAPLGEKVDNVSALGTALADETRELALAQEEIRRVRVLGGKL